MAFFANTFETLDTFCANRNLQKTKDLVDEFKLTTVEDAKKYVYNAFCHACLHGHLEVVKYLVETFHISIYDERTRHHIAFHSACFKGHFKIVKYLVDNFKMTIYDVMGINNIAFHDACRSGDLETVQFLVLNTDIRIIDGMALWSACIMRHFHIATYLESEFRHKRDDLHKYVKCCFKSTSNVEIMSWYARKCPDADLTFMKELEIQDNTLYEKVLENMRIEDEKEDDYYLMMIKPAANFIE